MPYDTEWSTRSLKTRRSHERACRVPWRDESNSLSIAEPEDMRNQAVLVSDIIRVELTISTVAAALAVLSLTSLIGCSGIPLKSVENETSAPDRVLVLALGFLYATTCWSQLDV